MCRVGVQLLSIAWLWLGGGNIATAAVAVAVALVVVVSAAAVAGSVVLTCAAATVAAAVAAVAVAVGRGCRRGGVSRCRARRHRRLWPWRTRACDEDVAPPGGVRAPHMAHTEV